MPDEVTDESNICYYFAKTATCRYSGRCTKTHPRPTLSTAILFPNFFSHFKLEKSVRDEFDSDIGLEYEDKELYSEFLEFYEDVVPELRKSGTLIQFKVCCNLEPHLRGNVYVQYETIRESIEVFRKFNGRFYNGKQLSLQFIKIDSWRSAICGSFLRKACIKGRTCNYLHVFRNPTKEFVQADRDWKEYQPPPTIQSRISKFNSISSTPTNASLKVNSTPILADQIKESEKSKITSCKEKVGPSETPREDSTKRRSSVERGNLEDTPSSSHSLTKSKSLSHNRTSVKTRTKGKHEKSVSNESRHTKKHKKSSTSSSLSPKKRKKSKSKKKKEKKSKKSKKSERSQKQ